MRSANGIRFRASKPCPDCAQLRAKLDDALSGLRYIEQRHGRLDGVGWDRLLGAATDKADGPQTPQTDAKG